jgi:endonuclease/exonuclease/phosphatase family metal-dependent hydrolase
MKSRIRVLVALAALAVAASLSATPPAPAAGGTPVTAMTWNLYLGFDEGDLFEAAASGDPVELAFAVSAAWTHLKFYDFDSRAAAIAEKVKAANPELLAVQEAVQYVLIDGTSCNPMTKPSKCKVLEVIDHIQILLEKLNEQGVPYAALNVLNDTEAMLPDAEGNYVRFLDRTAILVRADLLHDRGNVRVKKIWNGTFKNLISLCVVANADNTCAVPLTIKRGWASVDVETKDSTFRFVTAHLEDAGVTPDPQIEQLQLAQAYELVTGKAFATKDPIVLMGDFNTDAHANWTTYQFFVGPPPSGAGLTDAWSETHPDDPGLTWALNPDLLLGTPYTQRLDLALLRGSGLSILSTEVVEAATATFRASDHAGLVLTFVP